MSERALCKSCGGNGVVKIAGGIMVCGRCQGDCYEPDTTRAELDALRAALTALVEEWKESASHNEKASGGYGGVLFAERAEVYRICMKKVAKLLPGVTLPDQEQP